MIKKPNNWESVQTFSERKKLPLGAYVCRIKQAVVQPTNYGEQLCVLFDIEDGEHAGFYAADFRNNKNPDKKWRGVLRQFLPADDGSEKDDLTKSSLKGLITSIEKSNPGFTWGWDEQALSGKLVGIIFRNEEWEYNGKHGWAVRPFRACSVDTVADGTYTIPDDQPLRKAAPAPTSGYQGGGFSAGGFNPGGFTGNGFAAPAPGFSVFDYDDAKLPF